MKLRLAWLLLRLSRRRLLRYCAWCDRALLACEWVSADEVIERLPGFLERLTREQRITHGLCPDCVEADAWLRARAGSMIGRSEAPLF